MASTLSRLPGKFVWFEHVSNDVAKARAFYEQLFGWHVEVMPMGDQPYHMIHNAGGGIGGLRTAESGMPNHWMSYLSVERVDDSHAKALANGARETLPPTDFADVGRGSGLIDPTGASFCLWTSTRSDEPDVDTVPAGHFVWNELWTPDTKKALAFYEKTFGYKHSSMTSPGTGEPYLVLESQGKGRGGIFHAGEPGMPTMWMPYVNVDDCEAATRRAEKLGAKVFMPATAVPEVGTIAAMTDPFGAALALIKPSPRQG